MESEIAVSHKASHKNNRFLRNRRMVPRDAVLRNHSFYCMFWMVPEEPTDGSKRAHVKKSKLLVYVLDVS